MKILFSTLLILCSLSLQAEEKTPVYKNWKVFQSDYGYEFKYPDCWSIGGNSPDETGIATASFREIGTVESDTCKRPKMDPEIPNGIGISAGWRPMNSKDEGLKKIKSIEKHADNNVARDEWKIYKRLRIEGDGEALIYVENHHDVKFTWIRWHMDLYCPTQHIVIGGPSIRNPDESYTKKFKADDLALPEPEKTVYASIRCIKPKK